MHSNRPQPCSDPPRHRITGHGTADYRGSEHRTQYVSCRQRPRAIEDTRITLEHIRAVAPSQGVTPGCVASSRARGRGLVAVGPSDMAVVEWPADDKLSPLLSPPLCSDREPLIGTGFLVHLCVSSCSGVSRAQETILPESLQSLLWLNRKSNIFWRKEHLGKRGGGGGDAGSVPSLRRGHGCSPLPQGLPASL